MTIKNKFNIGDKVKFTGKFLKSTGQRAGSAGLDTFTVTGIELHWVVTDQELPRDYCTNMWTAEEFANDPSLKFRRIAAANLYKVGTLTTDNCP